MHRKKQEAGGVGVLLWKKTPASYLHLNYTARTWRFCLYHRVSCCTRLRIHWLTIVLLHCTAKTETRGKYMTLEGPPPQAVLYRTCCFGTPRP